MPLDSPISQPLESGPRHTGLGVVKGWPPRKKQVTIRYVLLGCSYLAFGLVVGVMFWHHGYTTTTSFSSAVGGSSSATPIVQSSQSVYQVNPGPVIVLLILLAGALLVSTLSLAFRVARHSPKVSVPGVVAASVTGVIGILGLLSVGPFILPLAALLLILAIPMDKFTP